MENTKIMTRAWKISRASAAKHGGKASEYIAEALRISWKMARLAKIENELFILNMKDLSGGRNNIFAQNQIRENNKAIAEANRRIEALKREIYPTVTTVEENDAAAAVRACIERNEKGMDRITKAADREQIERMNAEMREQLGRMQPTVRQWIDVNAYGDIA